MQTEQQRESNTNPEEILSASQNSDQNSDQNLSDNDNSWFKKNIYYVILVSLLIIALVAIGFYWYNSSPEQNGNSESLNTNNSQTQQKDMNEKIENILEYDQLILTEDEVKERFSFLTLDKDNSGEINNKSEVSFTALMPFFEDIDIELFNDAGMDFLGGYSNYFSVDENQVSGNFESRYLRYNLDNKVVSFATIEGATNYVNNIKSACISGFDEIMGINQEDTGENVVEVDIGDGGVRCEVFSNLLVFRIQNTVNILHLYSDIEDFNEIIYFAEIQANKYN